MNKLFLSVLCLKSLKQRRYSKKLFEAWYVSQTVPEIISVTFLEDISTNL